MAYSIVLSENRPILIIKQLIKTKKATSLSLPLLFVVFSHT